MKNDDHDTLARVLLGVVSAKFGPGALGRIGTIAITAFVVLALMASIIAFIDVRLAFGIVLLIVLLAFYVLHRSFNFAERHPEISAMTGTEISKVLNHQGSMKPLEGVNQPPLVIEAAIQNPMIEHQEGGT